MDTANRLGCLINGSEGYAFYVPYDFTKIDFQFPSSLLARATETTGLLGQLEGTTEHLADKQRLAIRFAHIESYYSQSLAGIEIDYFDSLSYFLKRRGGKGKDKDKNKKAQQIADGQRALLAGLQKGQDISSSNEWIIQLYRLLMADDSLSWREQQNWFGGEDIYSADFIPPPIYEMHHAMHELEKFMHRQDSLLPLLKIGLAYAQLETVRPFMIGNSRCARLLVYYYLVRYGLLSMPMPCLSKILYSQQASYYAAIKAYWQGDYEKWLDFFVQLVADATRQTRTILTKLMDIHQQDLANLQQLTKTSYRHAGLLLSHLLELPLIDVSQVMDWLSVSRPAAQAIIDRLVKLDILQSGDENKKYGRTYIYHRYVAVLV